MQTLQLDGAKAKKLFPTAAPEFREMLKDTFGETFFSEKITDRIKTFENACDELGLIADLFSPMDTTDEIAYKKLKVIAKALNEGWTPNWKDSSQRKYFPWFEIKSGGDFSFSSYGDWFSAAYVGSRLCYKSAELAEYASRQFASEYNDFLNQ